MVVPYLPMFGRHNKQQQTNNNDHDHENHNDNDNETWIQVIYDSLWF